MIATSSGVVVRAVRPSSSAAPVPVWICPNAPKRTFVIDRFIARPISSVSSVPDAPTSAPLTIRTFSCRAKPAADAASPVQAFSSEITTGMSAPPIGSTKRTPNVSEAAMTPTSSHCGLRPDEDRDGEDERGRDHERVDELLARIDDRPAADQLLQLGERDQRAGEGDRADDRRDDHRQREVEVEPAGCRRQVVELGERDQRHRAAADAVEERHHLRHRGHLHAARADDTDRRRRSPSRSRSTCSSPGPGRG